MYVGSKITGKEKLLRNASEIWLALNMSMTLLKQRAFFSFWVYRAAPLQPVLTLRHMKEECFKINTGTGNSRLGFKSR